MSRAIAVVIGACLLTPARAADPIHHPFRPGYRYTQTWLEDSHKAGAAGVDVGWAAIHPRGFELDVSTGLRALSRHSDAYVLPAWTASMALTLPQNTAPYLEFGFDLGEALARNLLEWAVDNPKTHEQIRPDTWFAAGVRTTIHSDWALKMYYKQHFIEGSTYRDLQREVWGVAIVHRIPRKQLLWWQIPL